MCGIWACLHSPHEVVNLYDRSCQVQCRGPDKTNVVMHPQFFMVFHRLAFHDLSPIGDQPFTFYTDEYTYYLMANGEIYNYLDLIQKHDLHMRSSNDCEVIFHLFEKYGNMKLVNDELDGEYAFVLIRQHRFTSEMTLHMSRDPLGVRPLFIGTDIHGSFYMSSLISGLSSLCSEIRVFTPGHTVSVILDKNMSTWRNVLNHMYPFYVYPDTMMKISDESMIYKELTDLLIRAVEKRLHGERPIACLLSGGLDSSLVCGIASHILRKKHLHTFTIGMEEGTDHAYATLVSQHLHTQHHSIHFTPEEGLQVIDEVIRACETWDITTIRASVGQFLLAKYISEHTDFKAILNGDGADEVEMGYLYWYNAPTPKDAHVECIRRLKEIHLYDGLRVDRCLGYHGLEARLPFLDNAFVDYYLSLPIRWRQPGPQRIEKYILRKAFETLYPDMLPSEVLWRKKEAFSDGVSSKKKSWYEMIQEHLSPLITDEEWNMSGKPTKEATYYWKRFQDMFGSAHTNVIPGYWLPKWCGDVQEPSARILEVYES